MTISNELLEQAIDIIAEIPHLEMDPEALLEDVVLLAYVWPDENEFKAAVASVVRTTQQLIEGKVSGVPLKYNHTDWLSYHYQHRRTQKAKADMRTIYQKKIEDIRVRGFGHRRIPTDIYKRLAADR